MGPGSFIPGFDRAQFRYDMHYDQPEDKDDADAEFETEDDIPLGDEEEERG